MASTKQRCAAWALRLGGTRSATAACKSALSTSASATKTLAGIGALRCDAIAASIIGTTCTLMLWMLGICTGYCYRTREVRSDSFIHVVAALGLSDELRDIFLIRMVSIAAMEKAERANRQRAPRTAQIIETRHLRLRPGAFHGFPPHQHHLPGLIADSLPDGWGMLLMDRLFRKRRDARGASTTHDDPGWGQPWMVKFPAQGEHKEVCAIEHVYAELARTCGLPMPAMRHFDHVKISPIEWSGMAASSYRLATTSASTPALAADTRWLSWAKVRHPRWTTCYAWP